MPTAPAPAASGLGTAACGHVPSRHLPTPVPIMRNITATNAVRRQREEDARLADAAEVHDRQQATKPSERATLCSASEGAAEVSASTPAVTDTATVRT